MSFHWIKRQFCLVLCAVLIFGYLPVAVQAATDYSDYTMQLWSASDGGASGPMYVDCYYMEYQWWATLSYMPGKMSVNDRFESRLHFEKDASTGKYRLFYYGVHSYGSSLYTSKYYLTGATVPTEYRKESWGFYYGDLYGYEYVTLTNVSSQALLWEITSSGYLKTTYKNRTHYLWSTTTPYGSYDGAKYIFRLRTSTTAKGSYGMPVRPGYGWFDLSNKHAHTPGQKEITGTVSATCREPEATRYAIYCTDESCGAILASSTAYSGSKDPGNHVECTDRVVNECAATCQSPYTYEIETYCTGCNKVVALQGPFQEGELGDHVPDEPVREKERVGDCITEGSYESVVYCSLCSAEISRETVYTEFGDHAEERIPPIQATCTQPGKTAGTFCTICDTVLVEQTETAPTGHTPGEAVFEKIVGGYPCQYDEVICCELCGEELSRKTVSGLWGDVNCDGKVDNLDASWILQYDVELRTADSMHFEVADVSGDGKVDNLDASLILQYDAELRTSFPVEGK